MTAPATPASPAEGLIRLTRITDDLAHILEHAGTDEPSGTWTGQGRPDHGLPIGTDVDLDDLRELCAGREIADLTWEPPDNIATQHAHAFTAAMTASQVGNTQAAEQHWSTLQAIWACAWTANLAALDLLQQAGLTRFAPARPQRWVIASYEHHCSPHGASAPHIHNLIAVNLTVGQSPGCANDD
jgi:TrwC relaxase